MMSRMYNDIMTTSAFPLRFKDAKLRELVREVARQANMSQNELLETAAKNEVIARGALLADDLEISASRLRSATAEARGDLVKASMVDFVEGETLDEPLRPRRISRSEAQRGEVRASAIAAFGQA